MNRRIMAVVLAFVVIAVGSSAKAGDNIFIDLGRGPVEVHVPACYDRGNPTPLVMALHPYSLSGAQFENGGAWFAGIHFLPLSEEFCFLYLYPNGTLDSWGNYFWNATDGCCNS